MRDHEALRAEAVTPGRVPGDRAVRDVSGQAIPRHPGRRLLRRRATATARAVNTAAVGGAPRSPVS